MPVDLAETRSLRMDSEEAVQAGAAEIDVDQDDAAAPERERQGKVRHGRRFPLRALHEPMFDGGARWELQSPR